jgi:polyribonucleotide nucleotidyltransferase
VCPETLAAVGASAALMISDIPFEGPVSQVRVVRVDGELIANPNFLDLQKCDLDISVSGTDLAIMMVEGEMKEISEEEFLEVLEFAHKKINELNSLQSKFLKAYEKANGKVTKREYTIHTIPEEIVNFVNNTIKDDMHDYVHTVSDKNTRSNKRSTLREKAIEELTGKTLSELSKSTKSKTKKTEPETEDEAISKEQSEKWCDEIVSDLEKDMMRTMILDEKKRLDGRKLDEIRPIECEISILPRSHGSALFTRGETQSLTSLTLGTTKDEQVVDSLLPEYTERFILHYNFPPFSVGETGRLMTGRREIGHGHLA